MTSEPQIIETDINKLLVNTDDDNITSILTKYRELHNIKKILETKEEEIKNKLRIFLKEHEWKDYVDKDSQCSVKLEMIKREDIDKTKLQILLSPAQISQITKITTIERMLISTPELRKVLADNFGKYKK
jgi:hypothetical protein